MGIQEENIVDATRMSIPNLRIRPINFSIYFLKYYKLL